MDTIKIKDTEKTCSYCKEDCSENLKFNNIAMEKMKLTYPMCLHCAIEAIVERKVIKMLGLTINEADNPR